MPKLSLEEVKSEADDVRNLLVSDDEMAVTSLVRLLRGVKRRGLRLVYRNGDQYVLARQLLIAGTSLIETESGVLLPNASLVLSDHVGEPPREHVYIGDSIWYFGATTLASALDCNADSMLDVVNRVSAESIASSVGEYVKPIVTAEEDFPL